ncbi:transaldolase [Diaminobutyricibacter tongyongensis]|uniref:Transaldolase n=1 Tax=Leifsonia tongyongensis TaxID=1268043 RepID=A0A6L9Y3I3_9MICO|nr:transaldolase [Diaminobutyricibacter tongyongensis]NEN07794.1 transaldolase [Diaminobutyricibacter tongyongensis]
MDQSEHLLKHAGEKVHASSPSTTALLSQAGVSVWLDGISREQLASGTLHTLIATRGVVGVTTNLSTFASAVAGRTSYETQLRTLSDHGSTVAEAIDSLISSDVVNAAAALEPIFQRTQGLDGRVSIGVDPTFANQAHLTLERASYLWTTLNRPNVMIEIPATAEGIEAIADATASGISVNVTLLFSIDIYRLVIRAYLSGLARAQLAGHDLTTIHSVASFSVSLVDTEIDGRLGDTDAPDAAELRGTVGTANARLAYRVFQEEFSSPRAQSLLTRGARVQRLLWTSTGVQSPDVPDTFYVGELIAPGVVISMQPTTLEAFADHGVVSRNALSDHYDEAVDTFERLHAAGISYEKVTDKLLSEGVKRSEASWRRLNNVVSEALRQSPEDS